MTSDLGREAHVRKQLREQLPETAEIPDTVLRARNAGTPATAHLEREDVRPPLPRCRKRAGSRDWAVTGLQRKTLSVFTTISVCRDCVKQVELADVRHSP